MQSDYTAPKYQKTNKMDMNLQERRNNFIKQISKEEREKIISQKRSLLYLNNNNCLGMNPGLRIVDQPRISIQTNFENAQKDQVNDDDNGSVTSECSMSTVNSMQEEDQCNNIINEVIVKTYKDAPNKVNNKLERDEIFN